jgi:hypothetical protein
VTKARLTHCYFIFQKVKVNVSCMVVGSVPFFLALFHCHRGVGSNGGCGNLRRMNSVEPVLPRLLLRIFCLMVRLPPQWIGNSSVISHRIQNHLSVDLAIQWTKNRTISKVSKKNIKREHGRESKNKTKNNLRRCSFVSSSRDWVM